MKTCSYSPMYRSNRLVFFVLMLAMIFLLPITAAASNSFIDDRSILNGALNAEDTEVRLFEFIREMNKSKRNRKSKYWIYNEFIDDIGVIRIKKYLEAVNPSCHGASHALGKVIGEREPELYKGMQICADTCTYGCIHGVFKVYFSKLGKDYHQSHVKKMDNMGAGGMADKTPNTKMGKHESTGLNENELAQFSKDVNGACDNPVSVVEDFFRGNCAHGVGHAMGMLAPDTQQATVYCKVFSDKSMQYYCETGVFMERAKNIKKQLFPKKVSRDVRLSKAIKYCSEVSETMSHIEAFAKKCELEKNESRVGCFNALGFASRSYIAKNNAKVNLICSSGTYEDKKACVSGFAYMKKGHKHRESIHNACNKLTDKSLKQGCLSQVQQYYYKLDNRLFKSLL